MYICTCGLHTCILQVCAHFTSLKKPGRPPKKPKALGRYKHGNRLSLLQHIKMLTPTITTRTYMPSDHSPVNLSTMKCTFILHQPLQLTYGTSCLVTSIETTDGNRVPCPACKEVLELSSIHSAPDAIVEILNNLPVMFERCKNMVKMQHLSQHTQSNCEKYIFTPSPTVESIAATPLSTPVQQSELHAAGNILRRFQLHNSPEEGMLQW